VEVSCCCACFFTNGVVADDVIEGGDVNDDVIDFGLVVGGEEQLKMSSPYLAISSLRLKVGAGAGAGTAVTELLLSDGGLSAAEVLALEEEVESSESFSPSELLSLAKLVLAGGLVGGEEAEAVLKRW